MTSQIILSPCILARWRGKYKDETMNEQEKTVDEAHYGVNVPQLVNTVQKLAEVMAKLLEREAEK